MVESQWQEVLNIFRSRLSLASFHTWFLSTRLKVEGNKWLIITENEFAKDWMITNYYEELKEVIYKVTNEFPLISIVCNELDQTVSKSHSLNFILYEIDKLPLDEKKQVFKVLKESIESQLETHEINNGKEKLIHLEKEIDKYR